MNSKEQQTSSKVIWPEGIYFDTFQGMSEDTLDFLCDPKAKTSEHFGGQAPLPTLFWTTEIYSLGKCYRSWLNWPWLLPIPVYGDHGVTTHDLLYQHEIQNASRYHLTWNKRRHEITSKQGFKQIIRVPHPWITYRRKLGVTQKSDAKGTLAFIPHGTPEMQMSSFDYSNHIAELQNLPSDYHPIVYCFHVNEIHSKVHLQLIAKNLPVVTLGKADSPMFVDRFYDLASNFKFATSSHGGSELYYCHELGLKFFIKGLPPHYVNEEDGNYPKGTLELDADVLEVEKYDLFRPFPPTESADKDRFISNALGLDVSEEQCKQELIDIFKKEVWRFPGVTLYRLALAFLYKLLGVPTILNLKIRFSRHARN